MKTNARSRILYFEDLQTMYRFILLYKDLFVPYSDDTIKCESYVQDTPTMKGKHGGFWSRGHHDDNIINMMKQGYRIEGNMIKVHMTKKCWNNVENENLFRKEKIRTGKYKYVFEG